MDVRALTSADSLVLTMGSGPAEGGPQALRPTELTIFPRVRSLRQYPVSGASSETGAVESAEYSFSGIDRADLPAGDLVFQLDFEVEKGTPASVPTQAVVGVTNPQVGGEPLSLTIYPSTRMGNFIRVPRQFAAGGRLNIRIRPGHADDLFGMRGRSVRLLARPTGFAVNLVKSLAICAVQTVVVVGIGVTASVFLSWPVALLLTSVILMAGNLLNVVRGMLHTTGMQIFDVTGSGEPIDLVGRAVNVLLERTSQVIDLIVPDFTKFDPVAFIGSGLNIPMAGVASDLGWALLYLVVAMFIGYLSLHFKEVGR